MPIPSSQAPPVVCILIKIGLLSSLFHTAAFYANGQTDTASADSVPTSPVSKGFKTENLSENRQLPPQARAHLKKAEKFLDNNRHKSIWAPLYIEGEICESVEKYITLLNTKFGGGILREKNAVKPPKPPEEEF